MIRGGTTIVSVAVGGWLALRTYRSNQWWDEKRKAYAEAIHALVSCRSCCVTLAQRFEDENEFLENPINAFDDLNEFKCSFEGTLNTVVKVKNTSAYMLSDRALSILESSLIRYPEIRRRHNRNPNQLRGEHLFWDEMANDLCTTINDFIYESRCDLGVTSRIKHLIISRWQKLRVSSKKWPGLAKRACFVVLYGEAAAKRRIDSKLLS